MFTPAAVQLSGNNKGAKLTSGTANDRLAPGDYLKSDNGRFVTYMQVCLRTAPAAVM
jgi:hypothetical protein